MKLPKLSWSGAFKNSLGLAGISAVVLGSGVAIATAFGFTLPAALAAVKMGEVMVSGVAALTAAAASPSNNQSAPPGSEVEATPGLPVDWQIELLRHEFRGRVLSAVVSLVAFLAIGAPVAVIVFTIGDDLPVSAMLITALYAYLGLVRFVGIEQVVRPWWRGDAVERGGVVLHGATTSGGFAPPK